MDNKNLFKEAIADAKAVREAALANAKAALEEALTPKLQSMLAAKLNEMEYEEEGLEETKSEDEMEEGFVTNQFNWNDEDNSDTDQNALDESEELEEDFDLSEILAELEDEDEKMEEGKTGYDEKARTTKGDHKLHEAEDEEGEEEESVADMTIEDLKDLIKDIVAQETGEGGEEGEEEMSMDMGGDEEGGTDETVSLDEEEIDLEELLAELDALDETKKDEMDEAKKSKHEKGESAKKEKEEHASGKEKKEKSEMKEAIDTINTLRAELNEVNLLNAKLLYVNKIFKAKNLSESQKLQVIASFDKATTAKEAKVVYESLNATLTATAPKKQIKESLGFASKAAGVAPKKAIVETDDAITRMQKLANIIK